MSTLAAKRKRDGAVVTAEKANPRDEHVCCQCGSRMHVAIGDPLRFDHEGVDCKSSKWKHDYAISVIAQKPIGKCFALPGAGSGLHGRIESAPMVEASIPKGRMSKARRVDIGMKACLHEKRRRHRIGRLAIEVTNTCGKNAAFVADMKLIRVSVCEFDLGRMLKEKEPLNGEPITALISRWVNSSTDYKRWLHVETAFKPAFDKWMVQRSYH